MRLTARFFVVLFFTCPLALAVVRDWGLDRLVPLRPVLRAARVLVCRVTTRPLTVLRVAGLALRAVFPAFLLATRRPVRVYRPLRCDFFEGFEVAGTVSTGLDQSAIDLRRPTMEERAGALSW